MSGTALVVIDLQQGVVGIPVHDAEGLLERVSGLIDQARRAEVPVIHVQHQDAELVPGTEAWAIHPSVAPAAGEPVVHKTECDGFHGTTLASRLAEAGVSHLVIAGCMSEWCVLATAGRALDLGYRVTLVSDGHATADTPDRTALQIMADVNRELAERGARPRLCGELLFA